MASLMNRQGIFFINQVKPNQIDPFENGRAKREKTGRTWATVGDIDAHRNILYGGISWYPSDKQSPNCKLRALY